MSREAGWARVKTEGTDRVGDCQNGMPSQGVVLQLVSIDM